ncbi:DUF6302 family protein [Streptomyces sp. NPDC001941]|uniref:DUF6302 family protein n=1 Tax=Streptomyces sp. NPDC001941 TaxID=3154659 RepID=UPI003317DFD3
MTQYGRVQAAPAHQAPGPACATAAAAVPDPLACPCPAPWQDRRVGVEVSVRPASWAGEGVDRYLQLLAVPALAGQGVSVVVGGQRFLAVPVGGPRRGGDLPVASWREARAVARALRGRDGFPRVRVRYAWYRDTCHLVSWGAWPPRRFDDHTARGLHYGYHPDVINAFAPHRSPR